MTDRELLELAAEAAGIGLWWHYDKGNEFATKDGGGDWNPLTDDGDALRLAVKLHMYVFTDKNGVSVEVVNRNDESIYLLHGDDQYAATRRAIVRAAAEIGKGMK